MPHRDVEALFLEHPDDRVESKNGRASLNRLAGGRALMVLIVLLFLSGLPLLLDPSLDRTYFLVVVAHLLLGLALFALYYRFVFLHLRSFLSRGQVGLFFLVALAFTWIYVIGPIYPPWKNPALLPTLAVFVVFYAALQAGSRFFSRSRSWFRFFAPTSPGEDRLAVWSGVAALLGSWIMVHSGVALLSADFKLAHEKYFVHGPLSIVLLPLLALHFLTKGRKEGKRPGTKAWAGLAVLTALAVVSFGVSLLKNLDPLTFQRGTELHRIRTAVSFGGPVPAKPDPTLSLLRDSSLCGEEGCHARVAKGWAMSSHRFAGVNRLYLKLLQEMREDLGPNSIGYCDNCHDPVLALEGKPEDRFLPEVLARSEGVSCKICHFLEPEKHPAGNGLFSMLVIDGLGLASPSLAVNYKSPIARFQLKLDSRVHIKCVQRPYYLEADSCMPCHAVTIPASFNRARDLELTALFSSFRSYKHSGDTACVPCHMLNLDRDEKNYRQWDHRFPGSNQALSLLVPKQYEAQAKEMDAFTERYLRGEMDRAREEKSEVESKFPVVADLFWGGSLLPTDIQAASVGLNRLHISVATSNPKIGHSFPVGLGDQVEIWIELTVTDARGRVVFQSGGLRSDHHLAEGARTLGADYLDSSGVPLSHHQIWRLAEIRNVRNLKPGATWQESFDVPLEGTEERPLDIVAFWRFRRVNQRIADWLFDGNGTTFPVTNLSRAEVRFP